MWFVDAKKRSMPSPDEALPGRATPMPLPARHRVFDTPLDVDVPGGEVAYFGMGCFWGAERRFWQQPGVVSTAVGYAGGFTPNPTYDEVCSGRTGHNEVVRVVFDPTQTTYAQLVRVFFESHDPTQGMRQGNDVGTQYRSGLYPTTPEQRRIAEAMRASFEASLRAVGHGAVTTEIVDAPPFYFAEAYHQQYLDANPGGYCGLRGTGVACALPG